MVEISDTASDIEVPKQVPSSEPGIDGPYPNIEMSVRIRRMRESSFNFVWAGPRQIDEALAELKRGQ